MKWLIPNLALGFAPGPPGSTAALALEHHPDHLLANKIADTHPQFVAHVGDCVFHTTPKV
ncbi:MAG: hypothetical protein GY930_01130 [bacterium]|nr:hypothetical protein [bacterium]